MSNAPARQIEPAARTRPAIEPRGLPRTDAAGYVGVGTTKFDEMVADGRMPQPKIVDKRRLWDRRELDAAFDNLPSLEPVNEWDAAHYGKD